MRRHNRPSKLGGSFQDNKSQRKNGGGIIIYANGSQRPRRSEVFPVYLVLLVLHLQHECRTTTQTTQSTLPCTSDRPFEAYDTETAFILFYSNHDVKKDSDRASAFRLAIDLPIDVNYGVDEAVCATKTGTPTAETELVLQQQILQQIHKCPHQFPHQFPHQCRYKRLNPQLILCPKLPSK